MPRRDEDFRQWRLPTSHDRQGARDDRIKNLRETQSCIACGKLFGSFHVAVTLFW